EALKTDILGCFLVSYLTRYKPALRRYSSKASLLILNCLPTRTAFNFPASIRRRTVCTETFNSFATSSNVNIDHPSLEMTTFDKQIISQVIIDCQAPLQSIPTISSLLYDLLTHLCGVQSKGNADPLLLRGQGEDHDRSLLAMP